MTRGTTHVAVGFLDLGSLSCAMISDEQGPAGSDSTGPLRWIGYDLSPYAIAKASVGFLSTRNDIGWGGLSVGVHFGEEFASL